MQSRGPWTSVTNIGAYCLCTAWVLALFAIVSPYWLWHYKFNSPFFLNSKATTYGIGTFIASYTTNPVPCYCVGSGNCACTFNQWNHYDFAAKVCSSTNFEVFDKNGTAITTTPYEVVGKYGWCQSIDAPTSSIPRSNRMIYVMGSAGIVIFFLASLVSLVAPQYDEGSILLIASIFAFLGFIFTLATILLACFSLYNKNFLGDGGYLPLRSSSGAFAVSNQIVLYFGPSFWSMVVSCALGLFATIMIMYSATLRVEEANNMLESVC